MNMLGLQTYDALNPETHLHIITLMTDSEILIKEYAWFC